MKLNNVAFNLITKTPAQRKVGKSLSDFNFFLSPNGSDSTGDGTYENPWFSFMNVPINSKVGLLPGTYSTKGDYGTQSTGHIVTHGLFSSSSSQIPLNSATANGDFMGIITNPLFEEKFGTGKSGMIIESVEGKDSVIIDYEVTKATPGRDTPLFYGNNIIYKDLTFNYATTKTANYSVSLARFTVDDGLGFPLMIDDCNINITGDFSLNYHNGCSPSGYRIYNDVTFNGGNLLANYSCKQYLTGDTTFLNDNGVEYTYPYPNLLA